MPTWAKIVSYVYIGAYLDHCSNFLFSLKLLLLMILMKLYIFISKVNTFQCILVTDGQFSFTIFLYPRGGIQWTTGDASGGINGLGGIPAQVGFNAGDGICFYAINSSRTDDVINVDEMSNVMKPGICVYRVERLFGYGW